jgi:hypothetical protein
MRELLRDFIDKELSIVLLFLRSVTTIVIKEIDASGVIAVLASASQTSSPLDVSLPFDATARDAHVIMSSNGVDTRRTWCIVSRSPSIDEFAEKLSQQLGGDVSGALEREKLVPRVDLAVPLVRSDETEKHLGRLFTVLPLPIRTPFPCLINGAFALTSDRQHLRNPHEQSAGQIER